MYRHKTSPNPPQNKGRSIVIKGRSIGTLKGLIKILTRLNFFISSFDELFFNLLQKGTVKLSEHTKTNGPVQLALLGHTENPGGIIAKELGE